MKKKKRTNSNPQALTIAIIVICGVLVAGGTMFFAHQQTTMTSKPTMTPTPTPLVSSAEKHQIDQWIQKNDLNQYGDPKDTMYAGGNPLFNEATGKMMDRYEYILKQHPNKPWQH